MTRFATVWALGLVVCAIGHAQVAPNGALPGLPMSLLPPSPTSADNLRLIVPERQCIGSVRYLENPYQVSMVNNHIVITLGPQEKNQFEPGTFDFRESIYHKNN